MGKKRIVAAAEAGDEGQLAGSLPLIARVERPIGKAKCVGILELRDFSDVRRVTEQKLRPGVDRISYVGTALQRRQRAVKPKRAARRSESPTLRLEMVERELIVFESKAQRMRSLDFTQIELGEVLVVSKQELTAGAG